ncbi:hypothetical protein A3863_10400 [Priestia endophytica]|uniref:site-specific integrase n=1 Tax=Priestia endophytica TaxID=135735 RepID=UPI000DCA5340|nr:site-specific integrase [Priestia endophytica]RAS89621.1 hypothetical protein A3863_10400 [Priestia endophytica]
MELKSLLNEDKRYRIELTETYIYNEKNTLKRFRKIFEEFKKAGHVEATSFENEIWNLFCPSLHKDIKFDFRLGAYDSYSYSLKAFVLLRRHAGNNPITIKEDLRRLKDVISLTEGLKNRDILREYFRRPLTDNELYRTCYVLINYLKFLCLQDIQQEASLIFENLKYPSSGNRTLPPFDDVLIFNECVHKYFNERSVKETLKFYPIFLWWSISNILPMRPIEFLHIKSDCLNIEADGSYWITIPCFKLTSTSFEEVYLERSVLINKDLFKIIKEYLLELENRKISSHYLIPPLQKINDRLRIAWSLKEEVTTNNQFSNLLKYFYEEIIEREYDEHFLSRINPGDTRHFAIINMFLQGFNVLTITRLAGHEQIDSPSNYFTHAKHYSTSFVYKLAQRKVSSEIGASMSNGLIGLREKQVTRAKMKVINEEETKKWRRVDYGFCKDENFPNNCIEDCRLCEQYYEFKPSINEWKEAIKWLERCSKQCEEDINRTLDIMSMVSTDTSNKLKGISDLNENESKSLSIQLFKYFDHKAIIDARLLEERYRNEKEE